MMRGIGRETGTRIMCQSEVCPYNRMRVTAIVVHSELRFHHTVNATRVPHGQ